MQFTSFASSSRGNAYLLQAEESAPLLLEAGLPINQLRDKLREYGVSLSDLAGTLISHEHGDHSKAVKDLLLHGVDCHMSPGTSKALGVEEHHRVHPLYLDMTEGIQLWRVIPFPMEHDATEPFGFFIRCNRESLLFIPDTAYVKNRFQGITMIAVECNMISDILNKNIQEGYLPPIVGKRVRRNHMSLENLKSFLLANDLSKCRVIFLMHLSDGNSDEKYMKETIQMETGIPVEICK